MQRTHPRLYRLYTTNHTPHTRRVRHIWLIFHCELGFLGVIELVDGYLCGECNKGKFQNPYMQPHETCNLFGGAGGVLRAVVGGPDVLFPAVVVGRLLLRPPKASKIVL